MRQKEMQLVLVLALALGCTAGASAEDSSILIEDGVSLVKAVRDWAAQEKQNATLLLDGLVSMAGVPMAEYGAPLIINASGARREEVTGWQLWGAWDARLIRVGTCVLNKGTPTAW